MIKQKPVSVALPGVAEFHPKTEGIPKNSLKISQPSDFGPTKGIKADKALSVLGVGKRKVKAI